MVKQVKVGCGEPVRQRMGVQVGDAVFIGLWSGVGSVWSKE